MGPGTGNLTKHLLIRGAHVTSIEKDDVLFDRLSEEYAQVGQAGFILYLFSYRVGQEGNFAVEEGV